MGDIKMLNFIKDVLEHMPSDWLRLTTHRLDIYHEKLAKTEFLEHFESLFNNNNSDPSALVGLPTAYDYIRLGHPLSCILEWVVAKMNNLKPTNLISFSSRTIPVLAILRKNLLSNKGTQILYTDEIHPSLDFEVLKKVYGYDFELKKIERIEDVPAYDGSTVFISQEDKVYNFDLYTHIDFYINTHSLFGSILLVNGEHNENYVSEIQHVRRRETIAMTPAHCHTLLNSFIVPTPLDTNINHGTNKSIVLDQIKSVTGTKTKALIGSSGLSVQYAILMGLIHFALENHAGKAIKIIVPPNCYGGTNDQSRRVAACIKNVEIVDLPVDGEHDMVQSIDLVLERIALDDAVPLIIAEIPTNPRVEVPDLLKLKEALNKTRKTKNGDIAIDPVFILDQTFCPNVQLIAEGQILSAVKTISFSSGSKFPSGGLCTAGYCVGNAKANILMEFIELHLRLCDNEASSFQLEILAQQLPSMKQRIKDAYKNTRAFVSFIKEVLPEAKINFVSEELANKGFTPSVFSLDLPTKGNTDEERETYKRSLNHKLINLMITEIPNESKHCVSYGQLKGCYWTIPATSTQGTTKEGDKDYIARVAVSPQLDLELHKRVFETFVESI